jgi:hypothetical protein
MTGAETLLMTGALVVLCGIAGIVSTLSVALCDWLDAREGR